MLIVCQWGLTSCPVSFIHLSAFVVDGATGVRTQSSQSGILEVVAIIDVSIIIYRIHRVQTMQASEHVPEYAQRGSETQGPSERGRFGGAHRVACTCLLVPLNNRITVAFLHCCSNIEIQFGCLLAFVP
jgi:hypothetical protein